MSAAAANALGWRAHTDAFKRWFGASKVVDAHGDPRIVYHGTRRSFDVFRVSRRGNFGAGIYFASDVVQAEAFSPDGPVMPVYLSVQRPFYARADYDEGESEDLDSPAIPLVRAVFGAGAGRVLSRLRRSSDGMLGAAVTRRLVAAGHDGVIATYADGSAEFVVFAPTQVKSVFNPGSFDPCSPSILDRGRPA